MSVLPSGDVRAPGIGMSALAVLAGVLLVEQCAQLPSGRAILAAAAVLVGIALLPAARRGIFTRLLFAAACGALWTWWRADALLADRLDLVVEGRTLRMIGDVVSIPETSGAGLQFDFAPVELLSCDAPPKPASDCPRLPARVRLSWYEAQLAPRAAQRWQLEVRLRQPRAFANEGGFDYEGQLFREGIGATGYVRQSGANRFVADRSAHQPILSARAAIAGRIARQLQGSAAGGVIAGLAVGATADISAEQWRVFAATGTTHLIAISGLHVTMIAALAMAVAGFAWRGLPQPARWCRQDFAAACGAGAAFGYALLAGFSVPTQRTLVMLLAALAAAIQRRHQPFHAVLALALLAVLLLDPHAALSPGFWLSFGAVAAIVLALGGAAARRSILDEFLRTQMAVTVCLAPATLALFGNVSLVAPLVNLLAIPLFSLALVPVTLLGVALGTVAPDLGAALLTGAATLFELFWPLLQYASAWPGALVYFQAPAPWLLASLVFASLVVIVPLPWPLRMLALLVLLPVLFPDEDRPAAGEFDAHVLDVGQGLAAVVITRSHVLVYDTGPSFRSGRSAGELALVPFLRARGISGVDLLVVSHADNDHAGGARALTRAIRVSSARLGAGRLSLQVPTAPCERGEAWDWDGVGFEFLHPAGDLLWRGNDGSCVLRISSRHASVLLTGDIEAKAERWLTRRPWKLAADVVVVPHHGSRSSSTAQLVGAAGARWAIVSAGYANRWGFPHDAVVARWCACGAQPVSTAHWGQISLRARAADLPLRLSGHRHAYRRYWHAQTVAAAAPRCGALAPVSSAAVCTSGGCRAACGKLSRPAGRSCGRSSCVRSGRPRSCWSDCGRCNASAYCRPSSLTRCGNGSAPTRSMTS